MVLYTYEYFLKTSNGWGMDRGMYNRRSGDGKHIAKKCDRTLNCIKGAAEIGGYQTEQ